MTQASENVFTVTGGKTSEETSRRRSGGCDGQTTIVCDVFRKSENATHITNKQT